MYTRQIVGENFPQDAFNNMLLTKSPTEHS